MTLKAISISTEVPTEDALNSILPAEARTSLQAAAAPCPPFDLDVDVYESPEILKIRFVLANLKEIPGVRSGDVFFLRPALKAEIIAVSYKWIYFLRELSKTSFVNACGTFSFEQESALRFFERPAIKRWFQDKFDKITETQSYDPLSWRLQALENFKTDSMSMVQYKQWENFGDRFEPKPSRTQNEGDVRIEINISQERLEESKRHRAALDAEIVP